MFFYCFRLLFGQFWQNLKVLEKSRNPRCWIQDGRHFRTWRNCYVMWCHQLMLRTSKEKIFRRFICLPSFVVIALIFSELSGGGRVSPPPVPEDPKKPGLNRVNVHWASKVAAIFRYLYFTTAKMKHKSVKKSVICTKRNISQLPLQIFLYIATCDLLLSVRSVEFYAQVTEYATYKKQTTVLEQFGHGSGRFNWIKAKIPTQR